MIEALSEAKIQLSETRIENQELKEEIDKLNKKLNKENEVVFRNGFYYAKEPSDNQPEGPFCAKCYSDENKLMLVSELPAQFQHFGKYKCPKCNDIGG